MGTILTMFLAACQQQSPIVSQNISSKGQQNVVTPSTIPTSVSTQTPLKHLKIALFLPLSGAQKDIGESLLNAIEMGYYKNPTTAVSLFPFDTQSTADGALRAAEKASKMGINLSIGPLTAAETRATQTLSTWPVLSLSNDRTVANERTFIFGLIPDDQVGLLAEHLKQNNIQKAVLMAPRGAYGDIVVNLFTSRMDLFIVRYGPEDLANPSFITDIKNQGLTNFIIADFNPALAQIIHLLTSDGVNARVFGLDQWRGQSTILLDDALQGAEFAGVSQERFDNFATLYEQNYGKKPHPVSGLAYDAIRLCLAVSDGGKPIQEVLRSTHGFLGVYGPFRLLKTGLNERKIGIYKITAGQAIQIVKPMESF
ncbi:MAG: penicillin-binding protein activator [Alphaproteobacteria bacterium]|mgnify:CR=1 FL=1|nr:penicillin-binding protein activator [Alphaproteobacteria bacterium]